MSPRRERTPESWRRPPDVALPTPGVSGDGAGPIREVRSDGFRRLDDLLPALPGPGGHPADIEVLIDGFRSFALGDPHLFEVLYARPWAGDPAGGDTVGELLVERITACVEAGTLIGDPVDIAHGVSALAIGLATREISGRLGPDAAARDRRWRSAVRAHLAGHAPGPAPVERAAPPARTPTGAPQEPGLAPSPAPRRPHREPGRDRPGSDPGPVTDVASCSTTGPARTVLVVGIGPGDPVMVTDEATAALADVDVVVTFDKGERGAELDAVRRAVLDRARSGRPVRVLAIDDPRRDGAVGYDTAVDRWHQLRAEALERVLLDEVGGDEVVGVLVWGDPSLYDSTLRLLDRVAGGGAVTLDVRVVPGVSSLHLLTARHRIALHAVGGSVLLTTGRRLRAGLPDGVDDVVVFLDAECSFTGLAEPDWSIYWGAYLGMEAERLLAGPVREVGAEIVRVRDELRIANGWVFDLYLLRRR